MNLKKHCCTPSREKDEPGKPGTASGNGRDPAPPAPAGSADTIAIPGVRGFIGTDHPLIPIDEESPYRPSRLKPFQINETAVTNAHFAKFVEATGYRTEAEVFGDSFVFFGFMKDKTDRGNAVADAPWWRKVEGACWRRPAGPDSDVEALPDHPVVHVSWNDANRFAEWAGGRLPTEAEWEHAARGGLGDTPYPWGEREPDDHGFFPCNIWQGRFPEHNTEMDGFAGTAPARSFKPNGYGLYNMVGNVWEWTSQTFRVRSLKKTVRQTHTGKEGFKVWKGGSYLCHASYCHRYRIAARIGNSPDSSTGHVGFRLVYDLPEPS